MHVRSQNSSHRAGSGTITLAAKAGIEVSPVSFRQHTRIKLRLISLPLSQTGSVFVMYISVKLIFMERQLHACAEKRNIVLELHITDDPWFN